MHTDVKRRGSRSKTNETLRIKHCLPIITSHPVYIVYIYL